LDDRDSRDDPGGLLSDDPGIRDATDVRQWDAKVEALRPRDSRDRHNRTHAAAVKAARTHAATMEAPGTHATTAPAEATAATTASSGECIIWNEIRSD
jgi:hypothetical protein